MSLQICLCQYLKNKNKTIYIYIYTYTYSRTGWLRYVGSGIPPQNSCFQVSLCNSRRCPNPPRLLGLLGCPSFLQKHRQLVHPAALGPPAPPPRLAATRAARPLLGGGEEALAGPTQKESRDL